MSQTNRRRWGALLCWVGAHGLAVAQQPTTWGNPSRPTAQPIPASPYPHATPLVPASAAQQQPMPRPAQTGFVGTPRPPADNAPMPFAGAAAKPLLPPSVAAMVLVEKRAPETVNVGTPLQYEITVRNAGTAPVYDVRVEDELPHGAKLNACDPPAGTTPDRMAWSLGTLDAGAERRIRVELLPAVECELRATASVTFTNAASSRTVVVRPKLELRMSGPDSSLAGDTVPFRIQVLNSGSGPVTGLILRDRLPAGLQHPQGTLVEAEMGSLAPGETKEVTLRTVAVAGGAQINDLSAVADGGLEATAKSTVTILEPALQMRRIGPPKGRIKSELTFELELLNPGSAPTTGVMVADTLAEGVEFVGGSDGATFDKATRTISWRLPQLPAGGKKSLTYRVRALTIGDLPDKAVARADRNLEAAAETAVLVEGVPALTLEVVDLEDPIEVGGELTYEIRVVNQGSCPCTNIQITANIPDGLQPRDAQGPTGHRVAGQQVVFEPLTKLAVKADAVYRVRVKGTQPGDYRFKVQLGCEQLRLPVNKEESSRVYKD